MLPAGCASRTVVVPPNHTQAHNHTRIFHTVKPVKKHCWRMHEIKDGVRRRLAAFPMPAALGLKPIQEQLGSEWQSEFGSGCANPVNCAGVRSGQPLTEFAYLRIIQVIEIIDQQGVVPHIDERTECGALSGSIV
jgi:hypothetical protein